MKTATSSSNRGVFKALSLWLGLAALIVQGLAPLCAAGFMDHAGGTASVVICTAHGFEKVQLDAEGKPLPAAPSNASDCCTACYAPGGFTVPSPVLAANPVGVIDPRPRLVVSPAVSPRFCSSYITRGPPAASAHALA